MLLNTGWSSAHIHDFLKASSAQEELDNSQMHSAVSEEINMSNATSMGIERTKKSAEIQAQYSQLTQTET